MLVSDTDAKHTQETKFTHREAIHNIFYVRCEESFKIWYQYYHRLCVA